MSEGHAPQKDWDLDRVIAEQEAAPKAWWMSRRGVGIATVVVAQIAGIAGFQIDAGALAEAILHAISLAGLAVSYWGWLKARRPISKRRIVPGVGADRPLVGERVRPSAGPDPHRAVPADDRVRADRGQKRADRGPFFPDD